MRRLLLVAVIAAGVAACDDGPGADAAKPPPPPQSEEAKLREWLQKSVSGYDRRPPHPTHPKAWAAVGELKRKLEVDFLARLDREGLVGAMRTPPLAVGLRDELGDDDHDLLSFTMYGLDFFPAEAVIFEEHDGRLRELATVSLETLKARYEGIFHRRGSVSGPIPGAIYVGPSQFPPSAGKDDFPTPTAEAKSQWPIVQLDLAPKKRRSYLQVRDAKGVATIAAPITVHPQDDAPYVTGSEPPAEDPRPAPPPEGDAPEPANAPGLGDERCSAFQEQG